MSNSKSVIGLAREGMNESALDLVQGGNETLGLAASRYGERRAQNISDFVFGSDFDSLGFVTDYGAPGFAGLLLTAAPLGMVGYGVGAIEGAARWATGTTDYGQEASAATAVDPLAAAPAPPISY